MAADARVGWVLGPTPVTRGASTSHFDVPRAGLTAGARLGPYVIVSAPGAGGMGEVYRGRGPQLNREVAIKVLPADRLTTRQARRFVQEAQAASALDHPHIVTIHEIERRGPRLHRDGVRAGQSLEPSFRARACGGEALRVAIPVADALAAAHARGIVHRDLKPANVIVGHGWHSEGARLRSGEAAVRGSRPDDEAAAGRRSGLSAPGMIAGTAATVASQPPANQWTRHDIFSFGAMLRDGDRATAFTGASMARLWPP